jgi:hypothetical protein
MTKNTKTKKLLWEIIIGVIVTIIAIVWETKSAKAKSKKKTSKKKR